MGFRFISVLVAGLKEETSRTGAAPGSWEQWFEALDDAVVVIADRLELWMIDEFEYRKQTDENMERLNARLVDFESEVGKPSEITSEQVEPTLWGNIAALLDRNEPEDFKATND